MFTDAGSTPAASISSIKLRSQTKNKDWNSLVLEFYNFADSIKIKNWKMQSEKVELWFNCERYLDNSDARGFPPW